MENTPSEFITVIKLNSYYNDLGFDCSEDDYDRFDEYLADALPSGAFVDTETNELKCRACDEAVIQDLKVNFNKYCAKARSMVAPSEDRLSERKVYFEKNARFSSGKAYQPKYQRNSNSGWESGQNRSETRNQYSGSKDSIFDLTSLLIREDERHSRSPEKKNKSRNADLSEEVKNRTKTDNGTDKTVFSVPPMTVSDFEKYFSS